jgi:hypothetical protein
MAALSFKGQFVDRVLDGTKRQTIRNFRKYPIKPGETLYLYYGMRTKHCKKLKEVQCLRVFKIKITRKTITVTTSHEGVRTFTVVYSTPFELDRFAQSDGFQDWQQMKRWWTMTHTLPFTGQLIQW